MFIGFTGTRYGMSEEQKESLRDLLTAIKRHHWDEDIVGIHGDCVGADEDFDIICRSLGVETWCYPCTLSNYRAYTPAPPLAEPEHPLYRNKQIVKHANFMIACPLEIVEQRRSGTWSTVRYTRQAGKHVYIIHRLGAISLDTPTTTEFIKIGDIFNAETNTTING